MKKLCVLLLMSLLSPLVGCGGHVGLEGKVTYSDDGSPLTVGTVVFKKGSRISQGDLRADGTYTIGSLADEDGLPPGEYLVYVYGAEKILVPASGSGPAVTEPLIDPKYFNVETSGLSIEVKRKTQFDFQVDRYIVPKKK